MTPPSPAQRMVLVRDSRRRPLPEPSVRRYRLARLRLDDPGASRYEYLKRTYD